MKLWDFASDMIRFCMYLGRFGLSFRISSFIMHGKWSEMLLIMIAEEIFAWSKCGDLQNICSNESTRSLWAAGWKSYLWGKNIGTHQIEKFFKFFSFIYFQKINIEIADYRGIFIFLMECVNYGWHFFDKCFDIGIIIVIVSWSVNVADCNRPVKIVTRDINE